MNHGVDADAVFASWVMEKGVCFSNIQVESSRMRWCFDGVM